MPKQSRRDTTDEFMDLLGGVLQETGRDLEGSLDAVKAEVAKQLTQLSMAAGEPGYERAVIAARDNVALVAGLAAVEDADAVDSRILGVIQGGLSFGAKLLV